LRRIAEIEKRSAPATIAQTFDARVDVRCTCRRRAATLESSLASPLPNRRTMIVAGFALLGILIAQTGTVHSTHRR
jgi:hypothetical protein